MVGALVPIWSVGQWVGGRLSVVGELVEDLSVGQSVGGRWLVVGGGWPVGGRWFWNTPTNLYI